MRSGGTDHQNAFYTSGTYFIIIFSISPLQNLYHARAGNTARAQQVQVILSSVYGCVKRRNFFLVKRVFENLIALHLQGFLSAAEEVDLAPGKGQHLIHGLVDALRHLLSGLEIVAAHVDDVVGIILDGDGGRMSVHRI